MATKSSQDTNSELTPQNNSNNVWLNLLYSILQFFTEKHQGLRLNLRTLLLETKSGLVFNNIQSFSSVLAFEAGINLKEKYLKKILEYCKLNKDYIEEYDPAKEYLISISNNKLDIDPKQYLNEKAKEWLGLENDLDQVYFELTMVAAVARVLEPGCKKDEIWVLVGDQGIGKSQFCKALPPEPSLFTDGIEWEKFNQDTARLLNQHWIIECAEISAIKNPTKLKRFLSTSSDTFRQWWTKDIITLARRSIIIATTNDYDLLSDRTGNRRFWISEIPKGHTIPIEEMINERDTLWFAAFQRYNQLCQTEEKWSLSPATEQLRDERNQQFCIHDPLKDRVEEAIAQLWQRHKNQGGETSNFLLSLAQILEYLGNNSPNDATSKKITKIMQELGFKPTGQRRRVEGKVIRPWIADSVNWELFD